MVQKYFRRTHTEILFYMQRWWKLGACRVYLGSCRLCQHPLAKSKTVLLREKGQAKQREYFVNLLKNKKYEKYILW